MSQPRLERGHESRGLQTGRKEASGIQKETDEACRRRGGSSPGSAPPNPLLDRRLNKGKCSTRDPGQRPGRVSQQKRLQKNYRGLQKMPRGESSGMSFPGSKISNGICRGPTLKAREEQMTTRDPLQTASQSPQQSRASESLHLGVQPI